MNYRYIYRPFCNTKKVWAFSIRWMQFDGRVAIHSARVPLNFYVPEVFTNVDQTELGLVTDRERVVAPVLIGSDTGTEFGENRFDDVFESLWYDAKYGKASEEVFEDLWNKSGRFVFRFAKENDAKREADRLETVIRILQGERYSYLGLDGFRFSEIAKQRLISIRWEMMFPKRIKQPKANFFQLANAASKLVHA